MDLTHQVRMGQEGASAPNNAVHGHAAALELGAHGAVQDDDLAVLKPLFKLGHHCASL